MNIAIDGPAGAGKSTLAKEVAKRLHILYLDTGAMYRAIGVFALKNGIGTKAESALGQRLPQISLDMLPDGRVMLNGEDVTREIRTPEASMAASDVSSLPAVRKLLVAMQRDIAAKGDIVLDGRDIGTNVLPNAEHKFYITAEPQVRARRRYEELLAKGASADFEAVLKDVLRRDEQDMNRRIDPLRPAKDAVIVDTSFMDREQVVTYVLDLIKERAARHVAVSDH